MDHGRILAMETPKALKDSVGAEVIVKVSSTGDLDALAVLLGKRIEGATKSHRVGNLVHLHIRGATGLLPRLVTVSERKAGSKSLPVGCRAHSRECLHQPDGEGVTRPTMEATVVETTPDSKAPSPFGAASRAAFNALLLRDFTVLRKNLAFFIARTLVQPFLLVFVFLFVFPQIGQGIGSPAAPAASRHSRPSSSRAWWPSP